MGIRLMIWAKQLEERSSSSTGHKTWSRGTARSGLSCLAVPRGTWPVLGSVGRMCAGARQLLGASTGGTAAMKGPKSHLKGTLCPASSTWPCCGQLRNSSSSSVHRVTDGWPDSSLRREGQNNFLGCKASQQAQCTGLCQQQLQAPVRSHLYV